MNPGPLSILVLRSLTVSSVVASCIALLPCRLSGVPTAGGQSHFLALLDLPLASLDLAVRDFLTLLVERLRVLLECLTSCLIA